MNESKNILPRNHTIPPITAHGSLLSKSTIITGVYVFESTKIVVYACIDGFRVVSIDSHGEVRVKVNSHTVPDTLNYTDYLLWEKSGGVSLSVMFTYQHIVAMTGPSDWTTIVVMSIILLLTAISIFGSIFSLLFFYKRLYTGLSRGKKWFDALDDDIKKK